jgi:excisionase family DNA binding protein
MTENNITYLTIPEYAKLLRISRNAAYRLASEGKIPGVVKIGRTIRVAVNFALTNSKILDGAENRAMLRYVSISAKR